MTRYEKIHSHAKETAAHLKENQEKTNDNISNTGCIENVATLLCNNTSVEPVLTDLKQEILNETNRLSDEQIEIEKKRSSLLENIDEEEKKIETAKQSLNNLDGSIAETPAKKAKEKLEERQLILEEAKKELGDTNKDNESSDSTSDNRPQAIDTDYVSYSPNELLRVADQENKSEPAVMPYLTEQELHQSTLNRLRSDPEDKSVALLSKFPGLIDNVFSVIGPYYKNSQQIAANDKDNKGQNFTGHTEEHVKQVAEKTLETAEALIATAHLWNSKAVYRDPNSVVFAERLSYKDKKVLAIAALCHDIGMCGGYTYDKNNGGYKEIDINSPNVYLDQLRPNHSLNSALYVLVNRESLKANLLLTDREIDTVAVLCLSHSKSNSGLSDVNSITDWYELYDRLDGVVIQYNEDHPKNQIVGCDLNRLKEKKSIPVLATSAYALRIGDVSRDSGADDFTQSGDFVHVYKNTVNSNVFSPKIDSGVSQEVANAHIERGILQTPVADTKAKKAHIGEQNIISNHTYAEGGKLVHEITINDIDYAPYSTASAINEHLGEFASSSVANNIEIRIITPKESYRGVDLSNNLWMLTHTIPKYRNKFIIKLP